jgi:putative PIN family toxin of toxin-antitoxin system
MQAGRGEGVQLFTSAPLLAELTDILSRAKFAKKIAASLLSIDQLVKLYSEFVYVVRAAPVPRIAPDPDDDVAIGTALSAKVKFLITGDQPLLSVKGYEGVKIVSVSDALQAVVSL